MSSPPDQEWVDLGKLASGGGGVVRLLLHQELRFLAVAKSPFRSHWEDPLRREDFLREVAHSQGLSHPHLVRSYGSEIEKTPPQLLLEYLRGEPWTPGASSPGTLRAIESWIDLYSLVEALEALHRTGLLHLDLKPSNLRKTPLGRLVLLDLGASRKVDAPRERPPAFSLGYASPEQLQSQPPQVQSDLYGFGLLALEVLSTSTSASNPPRNLAEALHDQGAEGPRQRLEALEGLDPRFLEILSPCLAFSPEERPRSVLSLRQDFRDWIQTQALGSEDSEAFAIALARKKIRESLNRFRFRETQEALTLARRELPPSPWFWHLEAELERRQGHLFDSLRALDRAEEAGLDPDLAHLERALIFLQAGRGLDALRNLEARSPEAAEGILEARLRAWLEEQDL